ncbi:MAG: hypothetical protein ACXWLX_13995 [Rhizomicrobium sp.]
MPQLATKAAAPAQSDLSALRDLALSLKNAGQAEQALLLLKQLATSHPGDVEILRQSARLLNEQGRTLECLQTLLSLKALHPTTDFLIEEIRSAIDPTIQCFNQCLAAGNIEQAVQYADALAALLPGNVAAVNSALSCNAALGRNDQAAKYAALLGNIDPANAAAQGVHAAAPSADANHAIEVKPAGAPVFQMSPQQQQNAWLMNAICAALGPASVGLKAAS